MLQLDVDDSFSFTVEYDDMLKVLGLDDLIECLHGQVVLGIGNIDCESVI
jgi:hypothetical protein